MLKLLFRGIPMMLWKGSALISLIGSITGWKQSMALARHDDGFERVAAGALDQLYFSTLDIREVL